MITAVLDANTLASGAIASGGTLAAIIDSWRAGRFQLVVSEHVLIELARTLEKPYFRRRLTSAQAERFLGLVRQTAVITKTTAAVHGVATHPEDDLVLATSVSSGAQYLVTGDGPLQRLGTYLGVTILSPRAFLDLLTTSTSD